MSKDGIRSGNKDNSKRRFGGGGVRPDHNEAKKAEANERNQEWSKLSPKQQLEALDRRLGKDTGATKQRARLEQLVARRQAQRDAEAATLKKPQKGNTR
jgi:hypothetical protein